jgi:hypothetical protein
VVVERTFASNGRPASPAHVVACSLPASIM